MIPFRRAWLGAALAVSLGTVAVSAPARADDDYSEVKKRMVEAEKLYNDQKYEDARRKMLQACAVLRTPKCLRSLTLAEFASGHYVDAYEHGREVIDGPKGLDFLDAKSATLFRETVDQSFAKIGHLEIEMDPAARLFIDGKETAVTEHRPVNVVSGPHALEARLGEVTIQKDVAAIAGQVAQVSLRPEPPKAAPSTSVVIDVKAPPAHTDSPVRFEDDSSDARIPLTIGLAVGGVLAITGGALLGASSGHASDELSQLPPCHVSRCQDGQSKLDEANRLSTWSTVAYAGGALLLGGSVATFWFMRPTEKGKEPRTAILPGLSSVSVRLRF